MGFITQVLREDRRLSVRVLSDNSERPPLLAPPKQVSWIETASRISLHLVLDSLESSWTGCSSITKPSRCRRYFGINSVSFFVICRSYMRSSKLTRFAILFVVVLANMGRKSGQLARSAIAVATHMWRGTASILLTWTKAKGRTGLENLESARDVPSFSSRLKKVWFHASSSTDRSPSCFPHKPWLSKSLFSSFSQHLFIRVNIWLFLKALNRY